MNHPPGICNLVEPENLQPQIARDLQLLPKKIVIKLALCIRRHDPHRDLGSAMVEASADWLTIGGLHGHLISIGKTRWEKLEHTAENPRMGVESLLPFQFQRRN